ncbi:hypothetical protein H0H81_012268 [Sphagnurus paluster]|uniref:Uncharacterized protein n=1 Tax=Sphagnurus paluster TaxID=117069 RepID=A0A9P7KI31_9AGAR|nr:hypothetical protein H0H81_012268 [Sphagnurus paluster]
MRKELAVQLDEFLGKASPPSPSFGPKTLDDGIPIPLDGLLSPSLSQPPDRNLKRSSEHDERDGRPPAKGPRLSTEGQFSRYGNPQGGRPESRSTGGWGGRAERPHTNGYREDGMDMYGAGMGMPTGMVMPGMNMPMQMQMNGRRQQAYQPPDQKRGICRDYHNNGYCARGAMCKYNHGDDAVVPGAPFGMGGGMGGAYDPHEARMDMRPMGGRNQRAPLLPRIQQEDGSQVVHSTNASGELPVIQDLTPASTEVDKPQNPTHPESHTQPPHLQTQQQQMSNQPEGYDGSGFGPLQRRGVMNGQPFMPMPALDVDMTSQRDMGVARNHHSNPRRGGRGGTFGGEIHNFRPERRNDKTLVVEKIPEDKLTLEHVNGWFKRFGTVTNVAIDNTSGKALISFSNHDEAYAAWKSEDAVFNNRFVKLFWHRPMEGHGQAGTRMLAASAPLVANIAAAKETPPRPIATSSKSAPPRKPSSTASALAAKQQLLERQIAEQKSLMASLDSATSEEKKAIMARLRKLVEEMTTPSITYDVSTIKANVGASDVEKRERERLDKELEMHNASAVEGEESTEDLKAKLEKLKAEAASLGIADVTMEASYGGGYRPYRGRGRGARGYRGAMRGGPPPRASMKLDNRPKKLLVKGVREEGTQALRDWFETTGQLESLERDESGNIVVSFKSRSAAEQGLSKGTNVPTVGAVQISWFTGKPAGLASAPQTTSPTPAPTDVPMKEVPRAPSPEAPHSPHARDEEVVASGWGEEDGEDGMGML